MGLVALLVLTAPACRVLFGQGQDQPKAAPDEPVEEMSDDPEAGLAHLSTVMRQFNDAVANKQFEGAAKLLKRAESGIDKASIVTRSHPDFDDMADDVHRGRPKLQLAIETDRIERRNAAIDALIERGNAAMQQNATWLTELASRAPSEADVQQLDEALRTFAQLHKEGEDFGDEQRYRDHAQKRDGLATALARAEGRASKQLQLVALVSPAIDAGFAAADKARASTTPADQLAAFKEIAENFSTCVEAISDHSKGPDFDGQAQIDTRLGHLTLVKTQAQCAAALAQANEKLSRFGWDVLVQTLNRTVPLARGSGKAAGAAQADAMGALQACAKQTPGMLAGNVAQKAIFDTVLGKLKVAALVQACGKEAAKLQARGGVLGWQSRFEDTRDRADAALSAFNQATADGIAATKAAELLGQASGGFNECVERADAMGKEANADRKFRVKSGFGEVGTQELSRACKQAAANVKTRLPAALQAKRVADFLATCRGDEADVVQREGIPPKVESVGPGRVFVYGTNRIAFDVRGMRTDESMLQK